MRREWRQDAKYVGGIIALLKTLKVFRLFSPEKNFRTRSRQKIVSVPLAANAAPQFFWCASLDFLAPKKIFGRGADKKSCRFRLRLTPLLNFFGARL